MSDDDFKRCEDWIFTFGAGQKNEGYYVRIKGKFYDARNKMLEKYGKEWAFQYPASEWMEKAKEFSDQYGYKLEQELEVIEA